MIKKLVIVGALFITLVWHFLPISSPPGFTADEAAFGYNAYSIARTGKDEYGLQLPLRLKSFGDYKLPLYTYLSAPVVKVMGLNETSVRLVAGISALIIVIFIYLISKALFANEIVALVSIYFAALSPWIHTIARQAHETVLATALIAISLYLLIRFMQSMKIKYLVIFLVVLPLTLFAYHTAKLIAPALILGAIYFIFKNKLLIKSFIRNRAFVVCSLFFLLIVGLFLIGEKQTPAARVKDLFILNNPDIKLKTDQAKIEQRFSPFSIKFIVGAQAIAKRYASYFSPEFLIQHGDVNNRFGYPGISPVSFIEYIGFLLGFAIFIRKWKFEYIGFLALLLVAPLNGALTWQEYALTRVYPLIIVILPLAAYGLVYTCKHIRIPYISYVVIGGVLVGNCLSAYFYFIHYPKQAIVIRSMQAGYRELTDYIQVNYHTYDHFYISKDNGQPYIYLLFYLHYNPVKYQRIAQLSAPDVYGFGQVEGFDKFTFNTNNFNIAKIPPNSVYVFSQDEGKNLRIPEDTIKKIKIGTEEMFWIYENP